MIPGNPNYIWGGDAILDRVGFAPSYDGTLGYYANTEKWWCPFMQNCTALSTITQPRDTVIYAMPFICPYDMSIDKLSINVTTARTSSTTRVGIYGNSKEPFTMYPENLIYGSDTLTSSATGVKTQAITSTTLILEANNLYWMAFANGGSTSNPVYRATVAAGTMCFLGLDVAMGTAVQSAISATFTYGAFPNIFPSGGSPKATTIVPIVAMRVRALGRTFEGNITP